MLLIKLRVTKRKKYVRKRKEGTYYVINVGKLRDTETARKYDKWIRKV